MRDEAVAAAVREAVSEAGTRLRPDVRAALEAAAQAESDARARRILGQLLENDEIARADRVPLCQDTGTVWVSIALGQEERVEGDLLGAVDAAVSEVYGFAGFRASTVEDALCDRTNRGDNTPAFVDVSFRSGTGATVTVMLKGGGSDNASAVWMLPPSAGSAGIADVVVEHVVTKAASACPPLLVGVGVGGTFDSVARLSKKALLRQVGRPGEGCAADLEREVLRRVNESGVGPAGLGGDTTALAVHVETAPSHIASLPVAVNMGCCAIRSATVEIG